MSTKITTMKGKDIIRAYFIGVTYFFMLTVIGALVISLYSYFSPIDIASESSGGIIALIFALVVVLDIGLLVYGLPSPTIIAVLVLIAPILVLYKLIKNVDLIRIDRNIPKRVRNYIPPGLMNI